MRCWNSQRIWEEFICHLGTWLKVYSFIFKNDITFWPTKLFNHFCITLGISKYFSNVTIYRLLSETFTTLGIMCSNVKLVCSCWCIHEGPDTFWWCAEVAEVQNSVVSDATGDRWLLHTVLFKPWRPHRVSLHVLWMSCCCTYHFTVVSFTADQDQTSRAEISHTCGKVVFYDSATFEDSELFSVIYCAAIICLLRLHGYKLDVSNVCGWNTRTQ